MIKRIAKHPATWLGAGVAGTGAYLSSGNRPGPSMLDRVKSFDYGSPYMNTGARGLAAGATASQFLGGNTPLNTGFGLLGAAAPLLTSVAPALQRGASISEIFSDPAVRQNALWAAAPLLATFARKAGASPPSYGGRGGFRTRVAY